MTTTTTTTTTTKSSVVLPLLDEHEILRCPNCNYDTGYTLGNLPKDNLEHTCSNCNTVVEIIVPVSYTHLTLPTKA